MFKLLASALRRTIPALKQRRLVRLAPLSLVLYYCFDRAVYNKVWCIEDKNTIETRKAFDYEIRKLQQEFGQMAIYPEVRISMRGNTYIVEFEIDPRKCDTFAVLASFLSFFQDPH